MSADYWGEKTAEETQKQTEKCRSENQNAIQDQAECTDDRAKEKRESAAHEGFFNGTVFLGVGHSVILLSYIKT